MVRIKGKKRSYKEKSKRVSVERKIRAFYRKACKIVLLSLIIVSVSAMGWLSYRTSGILERSEKQKR